MFIKKEKKFAKWFYAFIGILGLAILKLLVDGK